MFRGLFNAYFWMVAVTGFVASTIFAISGRRAFMAGMLLLAAGALAMRRWTLQRIDAQQEAFQTGDKAAMRRLRMVHWGGMLANIAVVALVIGSVRYIV